MLEPRLNRFAAIHGHYISWIVIRGRRVTVDSGGISGHRHHHQAKSIIRTLSRTSDALIECVSWASREDDAHCENRLKRSGLHMLHETSISEPLFAGAGFLGN